MTNVLDRLPSGARVAIIRLRSLGDCVLTTPALSLLKQARPDLQDRGGGGRSLRTGLRRESGCRSNPRAQRRQPVARFRPQLALNLHGGATSVRMMLAAASGLRAGFGHFRFQPMYNVRIPRAQEILGVDRKVHTAEHLASAMFYLGVPHTEIPRARLFAAPHLHGRVPTPSCIRLRRRPAKTWPRENFLAVAKHLDDDLGIEPLFVGGRKRRSIGLRPNIPASKARRSKK